MTIVIDEFLHYVPFPILASIEIERLEQCCKKDKKLQAKRNRRHPALRGQGPYSLENKVLTMWPDEELSYEAVETQNSYLVHNV